MRIPQHIAIIMDGNGRWAKRRGLPRYEGHRRGIENIRKVVEASRELGVKILTLFCFSTENWQRPKREVDFLMGHFRDFLKKNVEELNKNNIRLRVWGERYMLSKVLQELIREVEASTRDNSGFFLNLAISYGSHQEITQAIRAITKDVLEGKIDIDNISEELLSRYLYTQDFPDPDLLIRTSGEKRISNFLLWQMAYTELYFTPVLWPDFKKKDLIEAIQDYSQRERRFGRVAKE